MSQRDWKTDPTLRARVADVLNTLGARAAGLWIVEPGGLALLAFVACSELPPEVAEAFARATAMVPLDRPELGIVRALTTGEVAVSRVEELPPEVGSGHWLRAFGAARSVAVPLCVEPGCPRGVFSIAMAGAEPGDREVAELLRDVGTELLGRIED